MKYKIVFIDIDGTIVDKNFQVSDMTKDVLKKLKDKGIIVVLTSGRNAYQVRELSKQINCSNYIIASNGTEVYDYVNNIDINREIIPKETVKEIFKYSEEHDLKIYLNSKYNRYVNKSDSLEGYPENKYVTSYQNIASENISQIVLQSKNYNRMLVLKNLFEFKYPDITNINSSISLQENKYIPNKLVFRDFIPKNISKKYGLIKLLDYLNITPEEAIAVGDGINDISMFQLAGYSVAMSNAIPSLKELASSVTLSNEEDGVAYALKKVFEID